MRGTPEQGARAGRRLGSAGFSLIEMIVAIAVSIILGVGLYFVFNAAQRASRSQKSYNDLQTNCTFAMDTIKNDLMLAGYRARNSKQPISAATSTSVTFEYWDDEASTDPPYDDVTQFTNHSQVSFAYDSPTKTLSKTIRRWHTAGAGQYDTPTTFVLASDVDGLTFEYLAQNNEAWVAASGLDKIRSVRINLLCRAANEDALYKDEQGNIVNPDQQYQRVALTAEVRPRNVAIAENPEDTTAPGVPSPITKVWDPGQCGCLQLKWPSNTESDIAGYTVFTGVSGNGTDCTSAASAGPKTRVTHQDDTEQRATLRNLANTNTLYCFAVQAYDKSGNFSAQSAWVGANPAVSVRTEGEAGNDSAITPLAPPAPGALTVSTPGDNQIQLSWTKTYSDCLTDAVFGYRVYRSANPDFTPEGNAAGFGNCIADESTLGADATSYLDLGVDTPQGYLVGCTPYYYQVVVVHCDPSQLNLYTDNDPATVSTYTAAAFASVNGTPTDGTRTSVPLLSSKAGYRRIILSLTNPSRAAGQHPDFLHTRIYFSTDGPPTLTAVRDDDGYYVVANGRLIPDGGGIIADGGGPHTINFDDENNAVPPGGLGDPQLQADRTYYFLAVAYDICKNSNEDNEQARSTAEQCNDCLTTEPICRDAPPPATNLRVTEGCEGAPLRIEWDYDAANYTTDPDFQGFRVVRCEGAGCVPLDPARGGTGTVLGGTYLSPDTFVVDDSVVYGTIYNYRVYAGDCYYQRWLEGLLAPEDIADNDPDNNASSTDISDLSLGYFDRARVVGGDQQTTLTADIDASTATIPVDSTSGWTRRQLLINSEIIECSGLTPTAFTDCWWRGAEGTVAISHLAGTPVRSYPAAPPRAAVTGDIALVPPTFLHNSVIVGARNTSARPITLQTASVAWDDPDAWLKLLIYDADGGAVALFEDTSTPLSHGSGGGTVALTPTEVPAAADDVPVKMEFLKSDGTVDGTVDLREEAIDLIWGFRNDSTGIDTCSRSWLPPGLAGIVGPTGPTVGGTTQTAPTWGTTAWPVPGAGANSVNAIIVPANSWNTITTNVHDTSGAGIASVRLYYAATDAAATEPPPVTGDYPGLQPYAMVEMSNWGGETWAGQIQGWSTLSAHNNKNVWYFIVAVDNEGNFDREPEAGQGAFQYYQQAEDPCLNTPMAPWVVGSAGATSVTLDWSGSWWGVDPTYWNTNGSECNDLAGFQVYHRMGSGGWQEVAGSPFGPATSSYTQDFTTAVSSLTWQVPAGLASPLSLSVSDPGVFRIPGKVKIDDEIFSCAGTDAWHLTGCIRAQGSTLPADHALGATVTQDLLALENNSYFVRAYDTCSTGAKYSDSEIWSEGVCTPQCSFWVSSQIQAGDPVWVSLQACEKAGNGVQDSIWVHVCSSVEGDDFRLTEDAADTGWFSGELGTLLGVSAGGGNTVLMVREEDTITIGGYASINNSWGDLNVCSGKTYGCGAAKQVTVRPLPTDPCMADHTPPNVSGVPVSSRIGSDTCVGSLRRQLLTWNTVNFPAGCTSTRYNVYYRYQDRGVWTDFAPANFAGAPICGGTTCQSTLDPTPTKINGNAYEFQVTAVCERNDCLQVWDGSTYSQSWESLSRSAAATDACP